ncbi:MAG TPA: DUF4129 domain-containing protein [Candidatus Limnocylindria bacterium]|nr:DUF4129 domain-containing protein [Candidatus Limnocylindria bacterium]
MRSLWPGSALIPAARALAEGSLIAVGYAALQAAGGNFPFIGPLELGILVLLGTAWARRGHWLSPGADAFGFVGLVVVAGAFGWLTDLQVRSALVDGHPLHALGLHLAGWLAAGGAFARGATHRIREDDSLIDERMMRWAVPALAIPWLLGHAVSSGDVESRFAAAAYLGTIFFVGAGLATIGLARLEALRRSTVGYWRTDRSWILMVIGIAVGLTVLSIPVAALLGIPSEGLLRALALPVQTFILLVALISAPAFLLAAWLVGLLRPLLGHSPLENLQLHFDLRAAGPGSDLPIIILSVIVAAIFLFEFVAMAAMLWIVFRDRTRRQDLVDPAFEERSVVVPERDRTPIPTAAPVRAALPPDPGDPTGAYLAALAALHEDGRWPRRAEETPAAHLSRVGAEGMGSPAFHRLASAYQLARYGSHPVSSREAGRARGRFEAFRAWLLRGQNP